ncbi:MAG: P-loop NTPase [Deltaproteobacteria bacterium]|nr:P-loop NTPase [Deltaproteobacteria bacterium]
MTQQNHEPGSCGGSCGTREDKHAIQDAEIKQTLSHIKNKILVMSGKGGVGKSSVAAYLSIHLAEMGYRVGLMDVDLHGPSIPRLLNLKGMIRPAPQEGKILPLETLPNLHVISIEPLMGENKDAATIWRGPLKIGVIRQFISDVQWPDLDYLIVDSPPGTGDEPLTIAQTIPDAKALIVTTPQEISLADVRKSINFCRQVKMSILGLVENMSGLRCPHCGEKIYLFSSQGGEELAKREQLPLLASLPIDPEFVRYGDRGDLIEYRNEKAPFNLEFKEMAKKIAADHTAGEEREIKPPKKEETNKMNESADKLRFAIPLAAGKLCAHFGHCEQFALIDTENGEIKGKTLETPPPHEPGVLPRWLHEIGADVIIAGGMGARAQQLFQENGIKVVIGAPSETPETLVGQYLSDSLITGANICDH